MSIQQGTKPGISINPLGVGSTESGPSTFTGGGGNWSWWDTIKQRLHDWGLFGVGGTILVLIAGAALYFFVPGAQPIINGVLRAIASIFPFLGSLVEKAVGNLKVAAVEKPLEEVIAGGQTFKDLLSKEASLTAEQKARVVELFTQAHQLEQDTATQTVVKTIKAEL